MKYLLCALALGLFLAAACDNSPPPSPAVLAFQEKVDHRFAELRKVLRQPLATGSVVNIDRALSHYYQAEHKAKRDVKFGVFLLNKDGVMMTGRLPDQRIANGDVWVPATRFISYKVVAGAIKDRRTSRSVLYLPPGDPDGPEIYVICSPVAQSGGEVGALCLSFFPNHMKKGISREDFLGLQFSGSAPNLP
ncbi:MAG: hypothetical protein KQJ78_23860 [Deltaproteobacteria bacterium]|nr:hypothetical protein [Deltaproteobacteria bacterium]